MINSIQRGAKSPGSARVSRAGDRGLFLERLFRRDAKTNTRDTCATRKYHRSRYFFGVADAAAAPASSTAKVQCASTFLPPDFASTITLHLSRNFFVT